MHITSVDASHGPVYPLCQKEPQLAILTCTFAFILTCTFTRAELPRLSAETTLLDAYTILTTHPLDHCTAPADELLSGDSVQGGAV